VVIRKGLINAQVVPIQTGIGLMKWVIIVRYNKPGNNIGKINIREGEYRRRGAMGFTD
jgi:hypothetical protein